jgi:PBP1b-binding outer membrane lipoprotein LpoB
MSKAMKILLSVSMVVLVMALWVGCGNTTDGSTSGSNQPASSSTQNKPDSTGQQTANPPEGQQPGDRPMGGTIPR